MESPIQKALKLTAGKKDKEIRVCDRCHTSMIFTFCFPYAERYCLNCGYKGGMFGTGHDVKASRPIRFQKRLAQAMWDVIYSSKGFLPPGQFTKAKCKKCEVEKDHRLHLSKAEKEWDEIATYYLKKVQGLFDEKSN